MSRFSVVALAAALCLPACNIDVGDLNNAGVGDLTDNPNRTIIANAATGLLIGHRVDVSDTTGTVMLMGILGREGYNFDAADPRFVTEMLSGALNPGSGRFGGNFWLVMYINVRNANLLLNALDIVPDMSGAEIAATAGFAKTIQVLDYLILIDTHDENGAVLIRPEDDPDALLPISCKPEVLDYLSAQLDEADSDLAQGGDAFPFPLSSGFAGFDTPSEFRQFNRAIKARVDVYREDYDSALDALVGSFVSTAPGSLDAGVYNIYGQGSGERINELNNSNIFAHPRIVAEAEAGDARLAKVTEVDSRTVQNITSDLAFTAYPAATSRIPIIRNEELVLLRAEARFRSTGDDQLGALADINFVRAEAGLAPLAIEDIDTEDEFIDVLLHERFMSLLFEGGHAWIDARRLGRLEDLPLDLEDHVLNTKFPIPVTEADARGFDGDASLLNCMTDPI